MGLPTNVRKDLFQKVCLVTLDMFSGYSQPEVTVLGQVRDNLGSDVSVVASIDGSHDLVEAFTSFLSSGYPVFAFRLLKRSLQWTASSISSNLAVFSTSEFIVISLKAAETRI